MVPSVLFTSARSRLAKDSDEIEPYASVLMGGR
jgi:hypothetical protein